MIAAVFSDSHGLVEPMIAAVRRCQPDIIIHLGDYERDALALEQAFPQIPLYRVCGNCDLAAISPLWDLVPLGSVRAYICHGHSHNVKSSLHNLYYAAKEKNVSLALFGHTHQPCHETLGSVTLINPGSAGKGRAPTWARLEIFDNGGISCEIREI